MRYKLFFKLNHLTAYGSNKPALLHTDPFTVTLLHYQCICMHLGLLHQGHPHTRTHTHTDIQLKKCNIGYHTLTHTYTHISRHLWDPLWSIRLSDPRGDDVIDVLPNKWHRQSHKTLEKQPPALSQTNTPVNVTWTTGRCWQWLPFRAGGPWLRAAARPTPTRCWLSEWWGCHGDQGASAWGRRPAAEDLPMKRFLCIWVNGKAFLCAVMSNIRWQDSHIPTAGAKAGSTLNATLRYESLSLNLKLGSLDLH